LRAPAAVTRFERISDWSRVVRYVERWDPDASEGSAPFHYGVWDQVKRDWVARSLTGPVAGMHAAILSLRFERAAERLDEAARWVDPPVHVELTISPTTTEVAPAAHVGLRARWLARLHDLP
jgi:hypothetical protein